MWNHYGDYKTGIMGEYKCTQFDQNQKILRVNGHGDVKLRVTKLYSNDIGLML